MMTSILYFVLAAIFLILTVCLRRKNKEIASDKKVINDLKKIIQQKEKEIETLNTDKQALRKQTQDLASKISAEVKDCKIGPWCNYCKHKEMSSKFTGAIYIDEDNCWSFYNPEYNAVVYCGKHLHELCPEWEEKSE